MHLHLNVHPAFTCVRARLAAGLLGLVSFLPAAEPATPPAGAPRVTLDSIVRLTYDHNLQVTAQRFDLESADLQFQRFIRNQSQFIPFVMNSEVEREVESELRAGRRVSQREEAGAVSVGMEKEFFDGSAVEANAGVRASQDGGGTNRNTNPFVEMEAEVPLFGSFTRLERTIERTFEESEMFNAWLDFIESVREAISESQEQYVFVQQSLGSHRLVEGVIADFRALEQDPRLAARANDLAQIRDQLQAYQSELAGQEGQIDSARIGLLDNIGLDTLAMSQIETMDMEAENTRGASYLNRDASEVIAEAIRNDVEIQVLEMGRRNEELKKDLALRGRWDIIGRVSGGYDFKSNGADRSRPAGYRAGLGVSVRRNDPRLLQLSVRQSEAEIRKLGAEIEFRRRQLGNEIRQNLVQAASLQRVVRELTASRTLRRGVFEQKRTAFLAGSETVDNLILARNQLFDTEEDLLDELGEFYQIVVRLNEASGQFFVVLGDAVPKFESLDPAAQR